MSEIDEPITWTGSTSFSGKKGENLLFIPDGVGGVEVVMDTGPILGLYDQ